MPLTKSHSSEGLRVIPNKGEAMIIQFTIFTSIAKIRKGKR